MSGRRYGFLIGLLLVWIGSVSGWAVALAAVLAGGVGSLAVRYLEGDLDLEQILDRLRVHP